ncbi:hypothetical protein MNEG_5349 [Monoraphidium neglectum]|uniref:DRBM domain-containing protein n=1 Tax=Monoraphidium neglectum TaxID=145388 RepID=A0A0D2MQA5_9CHLO|nr:hypothetical protein MNEG_5349 [Monoraphidium neglectum]KIZ02612.1 hypothetical protein MNEG_5349 [Monoraphidium neglectum]|eukprot:XP_013901631.1 hypothetical protein MNEG_5349 [Monoraphidium neglectum]
MEDGTVDDGSEKAHQQLRRLLQDAEHRQYIVPYGQTVKEPEPTVAVPLSEYRDLQEVARLLQRHPLKDRFGRKIPVVHAKPAPPPVLGDAPEPTLAQVEADMMGLSAATHPHLAALVSSLIRYSAAAGRPHPKNPVALVHEAAHALSCCLDYTFEPRPAPAAGFAVSISTRPVPNNVPQTPSRERAKEALGLPFPSTDEAAAVLGRAAGEGPNKRDAKNAASAAMLERALAAKPGLATLTWRAAVTNFPLAPERWSAPQPAGAGAGAAGGAAAGQNQDAAPPKEKKTRKQQQKAARLEEQEAERKRKEQQQAGEGQREGGQQRPAQPGPAGPPAGQSQHRPAPVEQEVLQEGDGSTDTDAGGGGAGGGGAVAARLKAAELPLLQRHLLALAARQPGAPAPTALALLNQYAPAAMLEVEYAEHIKHNGTTAQTYEATAVVSTRLQRQEVARGAASARGKRDARQLAAADALEKLLAGHEGTRRVADAEESGEAERMRRGKRGAPPRARSVQDARIDYSRPLDKRFKHGGTTEDTGGGDQLVPQRQRWGVGYGSQAAWQQQQQVVAPLPAQAAFLGYAHGVSHAAPASGAARAPMVMVYGGGAAAAAAAAEKQLPFYSGAVTEAPGQHVVHPSQQAYPQQQYPEHQQQYPLHQQQQYAQQHYPQHQQQQFSQQHYPQHQQQQCTQQHYPQHQQQYPQQQYLQQPQTQYPHQQQAVVAATQGQCAYTAPVGATMGYGSY